MKILTVPAVYVRAVLDAAVHRGCNRQQILETIGLAPELVEEDKARIPAATFSTLTNLVTSTIGDEYCGLVDQPAKPGTFAMMCYACINCATLGGFLKRSTQYHTIVTDCSKLQLIREEELARYVFTPLSGTVDPHNLLTMCILAITHRLANWLIGQTIVLESVNLAHARPEHAAAYNLLFRAPIRFGATENSLVFAASYLDLPIQQDQLSLQLFLKTPALMLMMSADPKDSYVAKVISLIYESVAEEFPDFEWVAKELLTTTGTLRRRLRNEGTSYQQLKDDIRRDTAIFNLNRGAMSTEEVAASVGFSEPTSFFRAFKRWTGVTPRAYLKQDSG
jgi:AraC-like DNA-binding protein